MLIAAKRKHENAVRWMMLILLGTVACEDQARLVPGTIVLDQVTDFPCEIQVKRLGIELRGDLTASVPDPSFKVIRDRRGRFYSQGITGGEVSVWSADGKFMRFIGKPGSGPGELVGALQLMLGADDSLYARDNAMQWSVFDSAGNFVRRMSDRHLGIGFNTHLLDDGTVLSTSSRSRGDTIGYFHIADPSGNHLRSFGTVAEEDLREFRLGHLERPSAYRGGDTFWAAQRAGSTRGYEIEEWRLDGTRLRVVKRDVPWFPVGDGKPRWVVDGKRAPKPDEGIAIAHIDRAGLLHVRITFPNETYDTGIAGEADMKMPTPDMYEYYYEVIDPNAQRVLASYKLTNLIENERNLRFIRSGESYLYHETPEGLPWIELVSYQMVPREASAPAAVCQPPAVIPGEKQ